MADGPVIMLVEDNPDDADLTMRALRRSNLANPIVLARDGSEALDHLLGWRATSPDTPPALPALVLLDIRLPRLSGLDVLQRLRADDYTRRLPVVMLTSSREERDILRSYDLGANSYVQKPVDFAQFSEAVGRLGMYWLLVNQAPPR